MSSNEYDVIIVGSGLVGAALASCFANTHLRVAILEKDPLPTLDLSQFELRINAYNLASEKLLRDIGVWQVLPQDRVFPFKRMFVCCDELSRSTTITASELRQSHLGHFIENSLVRHALVEKARATDNIDLIIGQALQSLNPQLDAIELETDQGTIFRTKLVVGCDGVNSKVRYLAKIPMAVKSYQQRCIVGTVQFSGDHQSTAWQRFLPSGPLGMLSLSPQHASLAWSCDEGEAQRLLALTDNAFIKELEAALVGQFGEVVAMGKRASFPLFARHAASYHAHRIAIVGDAAHAIHPLAGLGANLGFQDVLALRHILLGDGCDGDVGAAHLLEQYSAKRHWHNQAISHLMSTLNQFYTSRTPVMTMIQKATLSLASQPLLKKILADQILWMA